jgi:hypothetical protein
MNIAEAMGLVQRGQEVRLSHWDDEWKVGGIGMCSKPILFCRNKIHQDPYTPDFFEFQSQNWQVVEDE